MRVVSKGFTLIELLVVISIIGILAMIVFASLSTATQSSKSSNALQQLGQLKTAFQLFYENHGDYPPLPQHTDFCSMCAFWAPSVPYTTPNWQTVWQTNIMGQLKAEGILSQDITNDPWGHPYLYDKNYQMPSSFSGWSPICSMGPDGVLQTANNPSWPGTAIASGDDICVFLPND
jgi:type II secretion system protein G